MKTFPCNGCGAPLEFNPSVGAMQCPYCGCEVAMPQTEEQIEELDFNEYLEKLSETEQTQEQITVSCNGCGATTSYDPNVVSAECPYCGNPIVMMASSQRLIKPRAMLPFKVTDQESRKVFVQWVKSRWFAPNALKQVATTGKITGIYVPYWTFNSDTESQYSGQRGTFEVKKDKQKIKWRAVNGVVYVNFNNVLILATASLNQKYAERLEPWDLENMVIYTDEYMAGFKAESYQLGLPEAFDKARHFMDGKIRTEVRRDIGGDMQQITSLNTEYHNVTFKHILLPIWISNYKFQSKVWQFMVNARTGEVQGERPWSWVKILITVLVTLIVLAGAGFLIWAFQTGFIRFKH